MERVLLFPLRGIKERVFNVICREFGSLVNNKMFMFRYK